MRVVVLGAGGRLGRVLVRQLSGRGDSVVGVVRAGGRGGEQVRDDGGEVVHADVAADDLTPAVRGADAVVFAAAGDASHYQAVDHHGVARAVDAARQADVARFLLISANGAHDPASWGPGYTDYLQTSPGGSGTVARADVAATVLAVLDTPATMALTLELWGGTTPIPDAVIRAAGTA